MIEKTKKNYDDLSLGITEFKNSIFHYENGKNVLNDRIIEFQVLKNIYP